MEDPKYFQNIKVLEWNKFTNIIKIIIIFFRRRIDGRCKIFSKKMEEIDGRSKNISNYKIIKWNKFQKYLIL